MSPGADGGQRGSNIGNLQRGRAGANIRGKSQAKNPMAPRLPALKKNSLTDPYQDGGGGQTMAGRDDFDSQAGRMSQLTPVTHGLARRGGSNKAKVAKTNQQFKGSAFRGY